MSTIIKTSRINRGSNVKQLIKEFAPVVGLDLATDIITHLNGAALEYIYFRYISMQGRSDI